MNTNKVANEKHFQVLQEKDENFAKAILRMKNLEQVKATIYQKHFEKPYIGLEARIKEFESEFECCDGIEQCYRCDNNEALVGYATALQVIRTIAKENDLRLRDMLNDIFMNLNMQSDKKKTIFFIGGSDAGKSVISELFLAHYDDYEIGNFAPPNKHAPNAFPFAGLCGAQIYKASEWFMDNLGVVQKMKTLLEGNSDMSIERKYKQDISLKVSGEIVVKVDVMISDCDNILKKAAQLSDLPTSTLDDCIINNSNAKVKKAKKSKKSTAGQQQLSVVKGKEERDVEKKIRMQKIILVNSWRNSRET